MSNLVEQIDRHMRGRGWTRSVNPLGEIEWEKPDEWQVQVSRTGDWWAIGKFTDSDIDGVAVGRYRTESEGDTFDGQDSFVAEMISLGALPWECPYCGKAGGEPRTAYWREWQGCAEHGGIVEWEEERCSKCYRCSDPDILEIAKAHAEGVPF